MNEHALKGSGILVTRPASSSREIVAAIEAAAGAVVEFPALEILPRDAAQVRTELASLPQPDIAIFVSRNAVVNGFPAVAKNATRIAAIGPSTKRALEESGATVSIWPQPGFDSERLLEHPDLRAVAGSNVLIVRGNSGRELLTRTLEARGASVSHLATYERVPATPGKRKLASLEQAWRAGSIDYVIAMSVDTLTALLQILPASCVSLLQQTPLVTPSKRVIQTALEVLPGTRTLLADGPQAGNMVEAVVRDRNDTTVR